MDFHSGDMVIHWTYGLGKVLQKEVRDLSGRKSLFYAVSIDDMTIWVPVDGHLEKRLRPPTAQADFKKLQDVLSSPGEPLPEDRQERQARLLEMQSECTTASLCRLVRDLHTRQHIKSLNDHDQVVMKRAQKALLGEWGFALSIPVEEAEHQLRHLLASGCQA